MPAISVVKRRDDGGDMMPDSKFPDFEISGARIYLELPKRDMMKRHA